MALNERQLALYIHTVDLYEPADIVIDGTTAEVSDQTYPALPTYSSVKCYRDAKTEKSKAELPGQTLETNLFTIDDFHFDVAQPIGNNWMIKFTTAGHPDAGMWFVVLGAPKVKNWRANKQSVLAKRSTRPKGVS